MIIKGKLYLSMKDILAFVREYDVPQPTKGIKMDVEETCEL